MPSRFFPALLFVALAVAPAAPVLVLGTAPDGGGLDVPGVEPAIEFLPGLFARAESTIDIAQMYALYYRPGSRGRLIHRLYDGLMAAAQRGVRVRLLLDSTTVEANPGPTYLRVGDFLGRVPGIEVRRCDLRPYSEYPECMQHAKYVVVDRRTAVVGSHNWSFGGFADNLELSLVVEDTGLAGRLLEVYDTDWRIGGGLPPGPASGREAPAGSERLAVTSPARLPFPGTATTAAIRRVARAESTLDVAVNSLTTRRDFGGTGRYRFIDSLLRAAAGRGVRVRLLVDDWAYRHEPELFHSLDSVGGLTVRVIDIGPAGPNRTAGTAHAKLFVADRREALVGSATLSQRQLEECRNVGLLCDDPGAVAVLARWFETAWRSGFTRSP